jgi:hypothetical protein
MSEFAFLLALAVFVTTSVPIVPSSSLLLQAQREKTKAAINILFIIGHKYKYIMEF